jgi:hypothetical protein
LQRISIKQKACYTLLNSLLVCLLVGCRDYPPFENTDRIEVRYEGPGKGYVLKEITSPTEIQKIEEWVNKRRFQWKSQFGEPYQLAIRAQFYQKGEYKGAVALGTRRMRWQENADYRQKEFPVSELAELFALLGLKEWQNVGPDGQPIKDN